MLSTFPGCLAADAFLGVPYRNIWGHPEDVRTFLGDVDVSLTSRYLPEKFSLLMQNVTSENFLNILQGNKAAMQGIGNGKVIDR